MHQRYIEMYLVLSLFHYNCPQPAMHADPRNVKFEKNNNDKRPCLTLLNDIVRPRKLSEKYISFGVESGKDTISTTRWASIL